MNGTVDGAARLALRGVDVQHRKGQLAFGLFEELRGTPAINEVVQACFLAIRAVAVLGKDTHHRSGDGDQLIGAQQQATVGSKLLVLGDTAEQDAEVDAGGNGAAFADTHGDEADVVGVGEGGGAAAIIEGDVELARQAEHVPRIGDVVLERVREWLNVDELFGVIARAVRGGDVADVVRAGAVRTHAEPLNRVQYIHDVLGGELADLDVGAGGQVDATRAPVLGHARQSAQLVAAKHTARDAHAEHKAVLCRGDVEEAVELEAVPNLGFWNLVFGGVGEQIVPAVQRIAFVLPDLFSAKIADGRAPEVGFFGLRSSGGEVGDAGGRVAGDGAVGQLAGKRNPLQGARKKALQVLFLRLGERARAGEGDGGGQRRQIGCGHQAASHRR